MKKILSIILLLIVIKSNAQLPIGLPSPKSNGYAQYGYLRTDSAGIAALRDTNWIPRYVGSWVYWQNPSSDSSFWVFNNKSVGRKWDKVVMVSQGSSSGYVKYSDTSLMLTPYSRLQYVNTQLGNKVNYTDTSAMLSPYYRSATAISALALKVNYTDTASMLSHYFNMAATNGLLNLKVSYTDTSTMLSPYYNKTISDGLFVHLTGDEIINGVKKFSGRTYFYEKAYNAPVSMYTNIIADSSYFGFYNGESSGKATFYYNKQFNGSTWASRLYYLPSSDGTLALVTDVTSSAALKLNLTDTAAMLSKYYNKTAADSKYVPYNGAIANVNIGANSYTGKSSTSTITLGTDSSFFSAVNNGGGYLRLNAYGGAASGTTLGATNNSLTSLMTSSSGVSAFVIGTTNTIPLIFGQNNIERARFHFSTGNLLIGTATDNSSLAKLQVSGSITADSLTNTGAILSTGEIYSNTRLKTAGDAVFSVDNTGLSNTATGFTFKAQSYNSGWYTPQNLLANAFVKIGGTSSQYLMADGSVTTSGTSTSGTYTPTLTNTTNLTGTPTLYQASYSRIGNIVTVTIGVTIAASGAGSSVLTFTLPFTSSAGTQIACGTATIKENAGTNFTSGIIDTISGTQATLTYKATTTGSSATNITFQYSL
jgi:hypothetical protein